MPDSHPYPIARVGIVGGGQLGRMLVAAAKRLACTCVVLDPDTDAPAGQLARQHIVGAYDDADSIRELAERCDVITYELEAIDADLLQALVDKGKQVHPAPQVLRTIQDKLTQKRFMREAGIPTAEFVELQAFTPDAFADFGYPLVQKARRGGYDGRGVQVMQVAEDFAQHLPVPSLLERLVDKTQEIALLVARGGDGETRCYPPVEMCFHEGQNVLDVLLAPARIDPELARDAEQLAVRTVEALDGVGVFGIELFVQRDGSLLVNEIAPRTHNSGHHTIEACVTDQFEQHLRAVLGLPLGSTEQLSPAVMLNLLGEAGSSGRPVLQGLEATLRIPGVCVHLYGKSTTKPHRKMGHVTVLDSDADAARAKAQQVRKLLKIIGEETL